MKTFSIGEIIIAAFDIMDKLPFARWELLADAIGTKEEA